jgi:excinuclease ABC subunit C
MPKSLMQKVKELPKKPGVYIFKDAKGSILYVGKANKLKSRVNSYFRKDAGDGRFRITLMINQIADLDFVITTNETEALILENNFIKRLQPKYNVALKDDKNYQFIKINLQDEIPTIGYERQPSNKKAKYLGPYTSSYAIKQTLRLIREVFGLCANSHVSKRPCFYYHIHKCPGVCVGKISLTEYKTNIQKIIQFLQGKQSAVLANLQQQMKTLSHSKKYEKAARVRDQIYALNRVLQRQKLVYPKKVNQDVFSIHTEPSIACINLFVIREGKLIRKENFILKNTKGAIIEEIFSEFLPRYYLEASDWPREILLPVPVKVAGLSFQRKLESRNNAKDWIPNQVWDDKKRKPKILTPSRGPKLQLIKLGTQNAKQYLENNSDKNLLEEARLMSALKELQRVLNLKTLPGRIEGYDISNIQGANPVGSMVVFDYGRPKKTEYRKFKINKKKTPDDFAMMREMLERRFARSFATKQSKARHSLRPRDDAKWPLADLILIDGGKGQLSVALKALQKTNSKKQIPIIAIAKRLEKIFILDKSNPIILPKNSIALFLLQRLRDEAHRFAITFHKKLRSKSQLHSLLDSIPGIGAQKKKQLLQKFGSLVGIKKASLTDLSNTVGRPLAEKIKALTRT